MEIITQHLGDLVLATGAVGVAAMGVAEGAKTLWLPPVGFSKLLKEIDWARSALKISYGDDYLEMIESLFRNNRRKGDLPRILRQGVRIGMNNETAVSMAKVVGGVAGDSFVKVANKVNEGQKLEPDEQNILGRFEVAADARIDGAFALAERAYINGIHLRAFIASFILSFGAAYGLGADSGGYLIASIVGITAVPIAPIAKDMAKGLQSAAKVVGGRK